MRDRNSAGYDAVQCFKKSQWVYYRVDNKFIEKNNLMYEFLKNKIDENTQLLKDVERLKKYKNSNFTCEQLR